MQEYADERRIQRPRWVGYAVTVLLEAVLTAVLLLLMPVFPIGHYPIPYILLTMAIAYFFAEGPAIVSIFLGWFMFTYFFVPPIGSMAWPLADSIQGWAQQTALLLGVIVVGTAMIQAKRSRQRIQRLADETASLNVSLRNEITEREHKEEALRESEERVRLKLDSILFPEGDIRNLELADIIDAPAIQSLMDSFYELVPIPMAVIDLKGKVLVGVGWQDICTKFHRVNPETCKHCIDSDMLLSAGVASGEFKLYKCKNNLWDVATPIIIGGEHLGNLFSGQFFFDDEPLDYEFFRSQASKYGFNEEEYIAALESVTRLSRKTLDEGMAFFTKLADMLSKLSYSNIKLARSLTERDTLTSSLQESEERFRVMADSIPQLAWMAEPDGYIFWYNQRWYEYTGTTPEQMEGWGWQRVHDLEMLPKVMERWKASIATGEPFEMEFPLLGADGEFRWFLTRVMPMKDPDGRIVRWFGTNTDISEKYKAEEEIRELNAELEQKVRERTADLQALNIELETSNRELEAFSYSVSHDLRAPLRAIDGFSNALLKNYLDSLDPKGQDYLQRVRAAAQRMAQLIDDILGLSRATRAEMHRQDIDLSEMVSDILDEFQQSQSERKAEIKIEQGLIANADAHLLRIALDNLLGNAWKFTGKKDIAHIEVGAFEQSGERVYYVKDNGAGFNPDYAGKLFSPFQRLHSESDYPGTGIGLALVQRILRKHGGRIWAESAVDEGATFFFTLGEAT